MRKAKSLFLNTVTVEQVWASSAYAYRINGCYNKHTNTVFSNNNAGQENLVSNGHLAHYALMYLELLTEADFEHGRNMRQHFKGLTFKALTKSLNDFEKNVSMLADCEDWNYTTNIHLHFAILMSLAGTFKRDKVREKTDYTIARANSTHIGNIKERLDLKIQVLCNVYSKQWETYYITGITVDENIVFFAYREELNMHQPYHIRGTVKAHRDNAQTQLNRVTVTKVY